MLFPLLVGVAAGVAIQRYILADEENRIHEIFDGFDRYYNKGTYPCQLKTIGNICLF